LFARFSFLKFDLCCLLYISSSLSNVFSRFRVPVAWLCSGIFSAAHSCFPLFVLLGSLHFGLIVAVFFNLTLIIYLAWTLLTSASVSAWSCPTWSGFLTSYKLFIANVFFRFLVPAAWLLSRPSQDCLLLIGAMTPALSFAEWRSRPLRHTCAGRCWKRDDS
jgi:hypothetical protein